MKLEKTYKYSVVIPHYNDVFRLERLLNSICYIDNKIEVIVVDDASLDEKELISLQDKWNKVTFLSTGENKGAGAARNIGLEHAHGEFLLFADADDEFLPNAFYILDKKVNDSDDITYFLANAWQEESNRPSVRADSFNKLCNDYIETPNQDKLLNLKLGHCVPWAKVYKMDFIKKTKIKFDETLVSNDVYFNVINAVLAKKIAVYPDVIYKVYRLADSLTSTTTPERLIQRVEVSAKTADKLFELGFPKRRSASGYVLESVNYGIPTFFKVLHIAINSKLKLNLFRVFEPKRWWFFFGRKWNLKQEKRNHKNR